MVYHQSVPYAYDSGSNFVPLTTQYVSGNYIAEIFPILDTIPENIILASTGNYELNSIYTTPAYTVGIINTPISVSLTMQ